MGDVKLLPCPFCGGNALLERDSDHHGAWFNLGCSRHWEAERKNPCCGGRIWYTEPPKDLPSAIAEWNTRALTPELIERVLKFVGEEQLRALPIVKVKP